MNEADLVARARAGDRRAFGRLLERHEAAARALAIRMVSNSDIGRELAQEAFLQAYLSLEKLRNPARFRAWLLGIVVNVCRNHLRSRRARPILSLEALAGGLAFDALPFRSPEPDPLEAAEIRERHRIVLSAIDELSDGNREAVLLFYFEQLSLREIASLLGISIVAVKGRLHKSRRRLRARLAPLLADSDRIYDDERRTAMIPVTVADVVVPQDESEHRVVVLLDAQGRRILPIWIGVFEANAIALSLLDRSTARPLTYDFAADLFQAVDVTLEEVRVEALKDETFFGVAKVRRGARVKEIDARPSDIIALAVRTGSPIYVAEEVMERVGEPVPDGLNLQALRRRGLRRYADILEEQRQAQERHLQEAQEEPGAEERRRKARQELLAHLFDGAE